jgi:hypothetical protein
MAAYTASHLAHALEQAFHQVLHQQPHQTLPTEVIVDGVILFFGGLLGEMVQQSQLTPQRQHDFLAMVAHNLGRAVEAAAQQRRNPHE